MQKMVDLKFSCDGGMVLNANTPHCDLSVECSHQPTLRAFNPSTCWHSKEQEVTKIPS